MDPKRDSSSVWHPKRRNPLDVEIAKCDWEEGLSKKMGKSKLLLARNGSRGVDPVGSSGTSGATTCSNPLANLTLYDWGLAACQLYNPKGLSVSAFTALQSTPLWSLFNFQVNNIQTLWTTDNKKTVQFLTTQTDGRVLLNIATGNTDRSPKEGRAHWDGKNAAQLTQVTWDSVLASLLQLDGRKHRVVFAQVCGARHPTDQQAPCGEFSVSDTQIPNSSTSNFRMVSNEILVTQVMFALR